MFIRFYKDVDAIEHATVFADKVMELKHPISPAQVQGLFMFYKDKPNQVMNNIEQIKTI